MRAEGVLKASLFIPTFISNSFIICEPFLKPWSSDVVTAALKKEVSGILASGTICSTWDRSLYVMLQLYPIPCHFSLANANKMCVTTTEVKSISPSEIVLKQFYG